MRLIDADELKKPIEVAIKDSGFFGPIYRGFAKAIDVAPTIGTDPVRHGHWMHDETGANYCSECNEYLYDDGEYHLVWHTDYCPHCGAKMDEVRG